MSWINPVPGGVLSQGFGPSPIQAEGPAYANLSQGIAHDPAARSFPGASYYPHFHAAIDIAAPQGTPIYAPQDATILDATYGIPGSWANGGGYFIRALVNPDCMWLVAHCSTLLVSSGTSVHKGQLIARVGHTGIATGNHAHFWIRHGPRPYYDPNAFYFDPRLILPGGRLAGDGRFEPDQLPDTGSTDWKKYLIDGDPQPMRYRTLIDIETAVVPKRIIRSGKPVRKGATVGSPNWDVTNARTPIRPFGYISKADLPAAEQKYGDVFLTNWYHVNGEHVGYIKAVDLE